MYVPYLIRIYIHPKKHKPFHTNTIDLASDDKFERMQIEDHMTNREHLYSIYQNILTRIDNAAKCAKEKLIHQKYTLSPNARNKRASKTAFNYHSPERQKLSSPELQSDTLLDSIQNAQIIQESDIKLPGKLQSCVGGNNFISNINELAAITQQHFLQNDKIFNFEQ